MYWNLGALQFFFFPSSSHKHVTIVFLLFLMSRHRTYAAADNYLSRAKFIQN